MIFIGRKQPRITGRAYADTATLRDFSGLWNAADHPLNLKTKYLPTLTNLVPASGTGLRVTYGYSRFFDLDAFGTHAARLVVIGGRDRIRVELTNIDLALSVGLGLNVSGILQGVGGYTAAEINGRHNISTITSDGVFYFEMPKYSTNTLDTETFIENVTLQVVAPQGVFVDLAYFDQQILGVTTQGYLCGIDDQGSVNVYWSPSIDKMRNRVSETRPVTTVTGSDLVTINIPNADGVPSVGDQLKISAVVDPINGIPLDELNKEHLLVGADKGNNNYTFRVKTAANASGTADVVVQYPVNEGWHPSTLVTHSEFNRGIDFYNGIDKPLRYSVNPRAANYVVDPDSGSNLNTPVAQFIATGADYTVVALTEEEPTRVTIAHTSTDNTFPGDANPNDSTFINLANVARSANPKITGLCFYQGQLIVTFPDTAAVYQLGTITDSKHVPELVKVMDTFGCISHRSMALFSENFLALDGVGVVDVRQATLGNDLRTAYASEIIAPHIAGALSKLLDSDQQRCWSLHDKTEGRYYLWIPQPNGKWLTYCYTKWPDRGITGWSLIRDWDFNCGCRTAANRLFVASGRRIYRLGTDRDPIYTNDGAPIRFVMETAWLDIQKRMNSKRSTHLLMDTAGSGAFTVDMFTDGRYLDVKLNDTTHPVINAPEFDYPLASTLSGQFVGGDEPGYGAGDQHFGGGRRSVDPRAYAWHAEFKQCMFRISGQTTEPLTIIALSLAYRRGTL